MGREIDLSFFRHQVDISKDDDSDDGLFRDLRAPAGFGAGVVTLTFLETDFEEKLDEIDEVFARATEGVMIVISPAEAELILAPLLDLGGAIAVFPINAFGREVEFAGEVASDELVALIEDMVGGAKAVCVIGEEASASLPEFFGSDDATEICGAQRSGDESPISVAFYCFEPSAVFFGNHDAAIPGKGFAFDFCREVVGRYEISDEFRTKGDRRRILPLR